MPNEDGVFDIALDLSDDGEDKDAKTMCGIRVTKHGAIVAVKNCSVERSEGARSERDAVYHSLPTVSPTYKYQTLQLSNFTDFEHAFHPDYFMQNTGFNKNGLEDWEATANVFLPIVEEVLVQVPVPGKKGQKNEDAIPAPSKDGENSTAVVRLEMRMPPEAIAVVE